MSFSPQKSRRILLETRSESVVDARPLIDWDISHNMWREQGRRGKIIRYLCCHSTSAEQASPKESGRNWSTISSSPEESGRILQIQGPKADARPLIDRKISHEGSKQGQRGKHENMCWSGHQTHMLFVTPAEAVTGRRHTYPRVRQSRYSKLVGRGMACASTVRPKQFRRCKNEHRITYPHTGQSRYNHLVGRGLTSQVWKTNFLGTRNNHSKIITISLNCGAKANLKTRTRASHGLPPKEKWLAKQGLSIEKTREAPMVCVVLLW